MRKSNLVLLVVAGLLVLSSLVYLLIRQNHLTARMESVVDTLVPLPVPRLYGIVIDSFTIETGRVARNQNLGAILQRYNLPERSLAQLLTYGPTAFDMRKMREGNQYTAFLSKDTLYRLQYFVYEHTPVEYVFFDFSDSVKISLRQKEIQTINRQVAGEIKTSLWDAVTEQNINPQVALELSDIYAWTVDFFGLQPGDRFVALYDEFFVDSVAVGLGDIHAASFYHAGKELLAIPFMQDSVVSFFDADGNSLRRAFLKAPLRFSRISSRFSGSRLHPILKIRRPHYGVDYAAPIGTPVYSIGDGRIISMDYQSGAGRIIKVRHNSVYTSVYMHLSGFAKGIQTGQYIAQGDLLGYVGSTGLSTGPHLDFRVYRNGSPIDPLKMESPPVEPIKPENREAFDSVKRVVTKNLSGF